MARRVARRQRARVEGSDPEDGLRKPGRGNEKGRRLNRCELRLVEASYYGAIWARGRARIVERGAGFRLGTAPSFEWQRCHLVRDLKKNDCGLRIERTL